MLALSTGRTAFAVDEVNGNLIRFNDNGAWSWFEDERAIIGNNEVLISSVANASGTGGAARSGNVEVSAFNLATRQSAVRVLSTIQADDHNSAALLTRPDGRYLALYSNHSTDNLTRYRVSTNPGDSSSWQPEQTFNNGVGTTYSNAFYLANENKTYNFTRTNGFDPNYLVSADQGSSWSYGGWLVKDPAGASSTRPYVKYASNNTDKVYFTTTDGHPRDVNNSIYAGYYAAGKIYRMDGSEVGPTGTTLATAQSLTSLTPVFTAQPEGVIGNRTRAWTTDLAIDPTGNPYAIFTTRTETDTNPATADATDHRFYYARWTGSSWSVNELAKAGGSLYAAEGDYTGLVALDPNDRNTLYMSSTINPLTNANTTNYEIYKGVTATNGATWSWTAITKDSKVDNLRPIVPKWDGVNKGLFWLRGDYTTYTNYDASVVGLIDTPAAQSINLANYVDATTANTIDTSGQSIVGPAAGGGNSTDNLWTRRTGFGNNGSLLTADETASENPASLRTRVDGLNAGTYDVWVYFWSNIDEAWQLSAGFSLSSLSRFEKQFSQTVSLAELSGADTVSSGGAEAMYRAYLGRITLNGTQPLDVFVDDGIGSIGSRTWYDGIGYASVPEPAIAAPIFLLFLSISRRHSRFS